LVVHKRKSKKNLWGNDDLVSAGAEEEGSKLKPKVTTKSKNKQQVVYDDDSGSDSDASSGVSESDDG